MPAHIQPDATLAIRQARHRVANPDELQEMPEDERKRLLTMAWAVLKTAQGRPTAQRFRPIFGGDAA